MKIAFLVISPHMPSTRFRVLQYLPMLAERRVKFKVIAIEPSRCVPGMKKLCQFGHYLRVLVTAWRYDLVFLQKPGFIINRWFYLKLLFRLQKKVIFDFDDAIFLDYKTGLARDEAWLKKMAFILTHSSMVIAGNPYLSKFSKKYNQRVEIIPTPIDCEAYRPRHYRPADPIVTVGWMGTESNLPYLFTLIPVIQSLLAEDGIRFLIVTSPTAKPMALTCDEKIVWKTWQAETEIEDLRLFDIGIMPLLDNDYTRGKCGFKLLQYMAVGIPVLASPVGMNREIVQERINGFLVADHDEWLDKLRALCADENLRNRMGKAGREIAIKKYSLGNFSGPWISLLQKVGAREK
ncbi:MAG: glycosyltransferase family 4 protein [Candidatus Aminicenantes bacterium]|nr:glycosyltransferase family 4 protein [Candidatus Aminicenantes bacterium]